jgi:hypothetical protein
LVKWHQYSDHRQSGGGCGQPDLIAPTYIIDNALYSIQALEEVFKPLAAQQRRARPGERPGPGLSIVKSIMLLKEHRTDAID